MYVYPCYDCGEPVWFPFGQKMHFGTGWYCWEKKKLKIGLTGGPIKFKFNTPKDKLDKSFKEAVDIYKRVKYKKDKSPIIKYLKKQIQYNRGDVIQKFLIYLTKANDRELDSELRKFFRSPNWEKFFDRQLKKNQ